MSTSSFARKLHELQYSLTPLGELVDFTDDPKPMLEVESKPEFKVRPLEEEHLTLELPDPASKEKDGYTVWGVVATWTEGGASVTGKGVCEGQGLPG